MSNNRHQRIKIGITIGDINGIGPEILIKAFGTSYLKEACIPILYGSARVINIYRKILQVPKFHYIVIQNASQAQHNKLNIIETSTNVERVDIGQPSESGGRAAFQALQRAIKDAQHGDIDAIVTLPVDKSTFQKHAADFSGHTEMLAKAFGAQDSLMMMVSEEMKIGMVTNHLPISEVARNISAQRIISKLKIMNRSLHNDFNLPKPKIAVLGLNPHAGDNGLIGKEDQEVIKQAIAQAKKNGLLVEGPYPADGFFGSLTYRKFDGILAMYHDQGLIPFKLISGYRGVNFTAGMPIVRTSPDHGVAYDIAGTGKANPVSFREAMYLAIDTYNRRKENIDLQAKPLNAVRNAKLKEPEMKIPDKKPPQVEKAKPETSKEASPVETPEVNEG